MSVTQNQIDRAVAVARRYGARRVFLFGSALDDPENARDLDLAVEGVEGWDFFRMSAEMEREADVLLDVIPLDRDDWFTRRVRERGRALL
jgi:predicted nucleotidyltransferase